MQSQVEKLWRHTVAANVSYYRAVGRLTSDYVRALAAVAREVVPRPGGGESATVPRPAEPVRRPTMVLEAEAGTTAVGAFVVDNRLDRTVDAAVVASPFVAPDGRQIQPTIGFEPPQIVLAPGEQLVVRAGIALGEEMDPGSDYRGEFVVPGLPGTSIPVVLRRRAAGGGRSARGRKTQTAS